MSNDEKEDHPHQVIRVTDSKLIIRILAILMFILILIMVGGILFQKELQDVQQRRINELTQKINQIDVSGKQRMAQFQQNQQNRRILKSNIEAIFAALQNSERINDLQKKTFKALIESIEQDLEQQSHRRSQMLQNLQNQKKSASKIQQSIKKMKSRLPQSQSPAYKQKLEKFRKWTQKFRLKPDLSDSDMTSQDLNEQILRLRKSLSDDPQIENKETQM